ncbi:MAG: class I SAM-dependent rRNA methyltransferase [Candidatus Eisenbacteria bacterium]
MFDVKGWVRLAEGEDQRLRDGHLWIYSNEIAEAGGDFADGDLVWAKDAAGRTLGSGFVNRNSKIAVRLLTRGAKESFGGESLRARLAAAIDRRRHLACDAKRLVNAEADLLPGLVVDAYGDVAVVQTQLLGWEIRRDAVLDVIAALLKPTAIVLKNDSGSRDAEGLERYSTLARGTLAGPVVIPENGLSLEVDVVWGQKTGFYIDQRENRKMVLPFVPGRRVLDCFCYTGAWSLACARGGAAEVLGLDSSRPAIELARRNLERNPERDGRSSSVRFAVADVFDELPRLAAAKEKFDIVILDPPSLTRNRKGLSGAERGYVHLNKLALGLLSPGGYLVTCSCSHHVSGDAFRDMLKTAASLARKQVMVLGRGGQPEDHPSLLGLPETDYLKSFLLTTAT